MSSFKVEKYMNRIIFYILFLHLQRCTRLENLFKHAKWMPLVHNDEFKRIVLWELFLHTLYDIYNYEVHIDSHTWYLLWKDVRKKSIQCFMKLIIKTSAKEKKEIIF